jgi:hypothetical protein
MRLLDVGTAACSALRADELEVLDTCVAELGLEVCAPASLSEGLVK